MIEQDYIPYDAIKVGDSQDDEVVMDGEAIIKTYA